MDIIKGQPAPIRAAVAREPRQTFFFAQPVLVWRHPTAASADEIRDCANKIPSKPLTAIARNQTHQIVNPIACVWTAA